ncbi:MAG: hypothetical protein JSR66_01300 [Proteobacteria bacterium]|nr:hypothetical protein [Pseudomonadota bacterium]
MTVPSAIASLLDREFRRSSRTKLGKLIEPIKHGARIPAGTLVSMASSDRTVRLSILEKEAAHKGFSVPLALNAYAKATRVTPNYLLWYLSHDEIRAYLASEATGSVILRVPRNVLFDLPVPFPESVKEGQSVGELVVAKPPGPFAHLLDEFYRDYRLNFSKNRFRTATILAGAICEMILYQMLLDADVQPRLLRGDSNLGLKKMLDYVQLLKLDQAPGFPMNHIREIQKRRNAAVHADLMVGKSVPFSKTDLECFNHVIRYFGI